MAVAGRSSPNQPGDAASRRRDTARRVTTVAVFAAIVLLAAALRLPRLDVRPMHADEAVHAAKFGKLLEQCIYEYDPREYHGPTLYYLALVPAHARGVARYANLDEAILRSVPAVAGVLLVAAHVLLVPVIGFWPAALAALLAAVSPAMVYYSRYFIQETLLATFSFAALIAFCRYLREPRIGWAIAAGTSVGLMFATKETWVIAVGSMGAALLAARLAAARGKEPHASAGGRTLALHAAAAALGAVFVAVLFFSSFFTHPRGILDSVAAYTTYAERAAGTASWHVHPWHYYLGLLLFTHSNGAPAWTEAAILALGAVGLVVALTRPARPGVGMQPPVFLAIYTIAMTVAYALIPYKTPWCVLGFLHGFALMAGIGAARLAALPVSRSGRAAVAAAVLAASAHLGWLAWEGSTRYSADPRNPYVYAHTGTGVFEIARHVNELASASGEGTRMPIEVISGQNLWPLPWYLRRFTAVRWETSPVNDGVHAPLILTTPDMEESIQVKLFEWRRPGEREMYVPVFDAPVELRPQVEVRAYAAKTLWDTVPAAGPDDGSRPARSMKNEK